MGKPLFECPLIAGKTCICDLWEQSKKDIDEIAAKVKLSPGQVRDIVIFAGHLGELNQSAPAILATARRLCVHPEAKD